MVIVMSPAVFLTFTNANAHPFMTHFCILLALVLVTFNNLADFRTTFARARVAKGP